MVGELNWKRSSGWPTIQIIFIRYAEIYWIRILTRLDWMKFGYLTLLISKLQGGWLHLTMIIDLFDPQVIGWSLSTRLYTNQTIIPAWKMATSKRKITQALLFHSDRGIQYASKEFRKIIKSNESITQSRSRKANCWDNEVAESFFKSQKVEWHIKTILILSKKHNQQSLNISNIVITVTYINVSLHACVYLCTHFMYILFYKYVCVIL